MAKLTKNNIKNKIKNNLLFFLNHQCNPTYIFILNYSFFTLYLLYRYPSQAIFPQNRINLNNNILLIFTNIFLYFPCYLALYFFLIPAFFTHLSNFPNFILQFFLHLSTSIPIMSYLADKAQLLTFVLYLKK